jgi:hypothetical protein
VSRAMDGGSSGSSLALPRSIAVEIMPSLPLPTDPIVRSVVPPPKRSGRMMRPRMMRTVNPVVRRYALDLALSVISRSATCPSVLNPVISPPPGKGRIAMAWCR